MRTRRLGADVFTAAFARHGRALWLLASAWVGRTEAEDLVQETARVAWERRAQCDPDGELLPWLAQITRHLGANARRKLRPLAQDPAELPETPSADDHDLDSNFESLREHLSDDLAHALEALPEVARACLLLHVVGELPFPQIATMLDIPTNTAMSHARRARLALRAAMTPSVALSPPQP